MPSVQSISPAGAPWREPANLNESIAATLRARRVALSLEHRDLDATVAFLAEDARAITGECIRIDCGLHLADA